MDVIGTFEAKNGFGDWAEENSAWAIKRPHFTPLTNIPP
jgi:hypothetical protein